MSDVLQVPYTYFPDASGGTEVYVRALTLGLTRRGCDVAVAAPGSKPRRYSLDGVDVHRFAVDGCQRIELAYGQPDEVAARAFRSILATTRPKIVHLHARTSAVSELLVDVAHEAGAKVVLTYHTPTVSCARGTMMHNGITPCDGVIETGRCLACAMTGIGAPRKIAEFAAATPQWLRDTAARLSQATGSVPHLRIPSLLAGTGERINSFIGKVDHVVAVCTWVRDVLLRNGIPPERITLSRQGISLPAPLLTRDPICSQSAIGPLRIAYFGRVDHSKGPDLLTGALDLIPETQVKIDMFAVRQTGSDKDLAWLEAHAARDSRLRVLPAIGTEAVISTMASYDLVAVPSRWLETGPLVVLEAFAAGVPVLGAGHGGIAELVQDGVNGSLVRPDDPRAWARQIDLLTNNKSIISKWRSHIARPRLIESCVDDMLQLYSSLASH